MQLRLSLNVADKQDENLSVTC